MYRNNYLAHHLRASSIGHEDLVFAKTSNGRVITYTELFQGSESLAHALLDKGLQPNDRVAAQLDKSIEALQLYMATIMAGGVYLPLNTAYTTAEVAYFVQDATPTVFVCREQNWEALQSVAEQAGISALETLNADGSGSLADAAKQNAKPFTAVSRSEDDLAAILYTSGTTGRSKGAMLSHKNLWSNADTLQEYWHFTQQDVLIHALPIFHIHGLFVAINVTLAAGSSLVFMSNFDVSAIMTSMPRATVLMGVPTFYVRLLKHADLSKDSVKNMRLFISGSAPLLAETHRLWLAKTGTAILERYGMTETNMNTSNPYNGERRPGTVGFPLPGVDVRITDEKTGELLPVGTVGAIEVRGPSVFQGYWQRPEKTREELRDNGFFMTGDLGMIDAQGYVSIIGRSKDLIITGGYNVYPKEVETLIDDIEGVEESAVIGLPHADFGETVTAVIVRQADSTVSEQTIQQLLSDKLAHYKRPKKLFFVGELPRNAMGKVQKKALRDAYG